MKKNKDVQNYTISMAELLEIDKKLTALQNELFQKDDPLLFEKEEKEARNGYTFIDIRNNPKERSSRFPTSINYSRDELLTKYEDILKKGEKYVLVDHWGNHAPFIQKALLYFGYKVYVIEGGLVNFRKLRRETKRTRTTSIEE